MEVNEKVQSYKKENAKHRYIYRGIKRLFDIISSCLALIVLSPLFLAIGCLYKFNKSDEGPLLYKQIRVGKNRQTFGMYKFRSMVVNAEDKLKNNPKLYKKYVANSYKLSPEEDGCKLIPETTFKRGYNE